MRRGWWIGWLLALLVLPRVAVAEGALEPRVAVAEGALEFALYAPNAPFESGAQRFAFIRQLAEQVTTATGRQASGKAFARAADLEAAIRRHEVDFAVLDGVYLAERNVPYPVLAVATHDGEAASRWALFSAAFDSVSALRGKRLSLTATGPRDLDFLTNALFDGELVVERFFSEHITAPNLSSAVTAVSFRKADAVFAPESQERGMKAVFRPRERIPHPALCRVAALEPQLVAQVRAAVLGAKAGPVFDGWRPSGAEPYRALAARIVTRGRRPVMVEPPVVRFDSPVPAISPLPEPAAPDLKSLYWQPSAR